LDDVGYTKGTYDWEKGNSEAKKHSEKLVKFVTRLFGGVPSRDKGIKVVDDHMCPQREAGELVNGWEKDNEVSEQAKGNGMTRMSEHGLYVQQKPKGQTGQSRARISCGIRKRRLKRGQHRSRDGRQFRGVAGLR